MAKEGKTEIEVICEKHNGDESEITVMKYATKMLKVVSSKQEHHIYNEVMEMFDEALTNEDYIATMTPLLDAYYYIRECYDMTADMLEKVSADTSLNSKYRLPIIKELKESKAHIESAEEILRYTMQIVFK